MFTVSCIYIYSRYARRSLYTSDNMDVNVRYEANGPKVPLVRVERPIPEPKVNGIIVKTHYSGVCHTDLHSWQNEYRVSDGVVATLQEFDPDFRYPFIFGHEISGEVYKVGPYVTNVEVGDKVCVYPWLGCSDCTHCRNGFSKRCYKRDASLGVFEDGGFQTHVAVPNSDYVTKLASSTDLAAACMFGCSVMTAYTSIKKIKPFVELAVRVTGRANVLLNAMGGVGLWGLALAKVMLPSETKIICVDISEEKCSAAKDLGADQTLVWGISESKEDIVAKTLALADGGVDAVVDYFGLASALENFVEVCNKGSAICIVGFAGGVAPLVMINVTMKELAILTVYAGTPTEMKEAITIIEQNQMKMPQCNIISPDDITDTMLALKQGRVKGRCVADFSKV